MPDAALQIPAGWRDQLAGETAKPYFGRLAEFVQAQRAEHTVFPPPDQVFAALAMTPCDKVKVLLLGQDPYHGPGQAHGLCFSVSPGTPAPPSLKNIFKEMKSDIGCEIPQHGCLASWSRQGVLLLNTVLTVRQGEANSHKKKGWEEFTDAVIRCVNQHPGHKVFVLWGAQAQKKADLIDERHTIIAAPHPSPLSASRGFFGSRPFSNINQALVDDGQQPIQWALPLADADG